LASSFISLFVHICAAMMKWRQRFLPRNAASRERERERLFANRQETRWRNGGKGREDRPA
jgi:hypothetical protein